MEQKLRLLAVAGLALALATGCGMEQDPNQQEQQRQEQQRQQQQQQEQQRQQGAGSEVDLTVDDILDNPDQYIGRTVAVKGDVGEMLEENRIFTLSDGDVLGSDELLVGVSNPDLLRNGLQGGDQIVVNGTVEMFRLQEVERRFNMDLDDGQYQDYEGKPAILAQTITKVEE